MSESVTCERCGHPNRLATRVSIHGMYDCHLFHPVEGNTPAEVITAWLQHNAQPQPATVGGREVADMGKSDLCPAIVLDADGKEMRRVGPFIPARRLTDAGVDAYRAALEADPDIPRLLASRAPRGRTTHD